MNGLLPNARAKYLPNRNVEAPFEDQHKIDGKGNQENRRIPPWEYTQRQDLHCAEDWRENKPQGDFLIRKHHIGELILMQPSPTSERFDSCNDGFTVEEGQPREGRCISLWST